MKTIKYKCWVNKFAAIDYKFVIASKLNYIRRVANNDTTNC